MKINLKEGVDQLQFGMKEKDVTQLYGNPDKKYKDEDDNTVLLYNSKKLRLTFYVEEEFRLGYIVCSDAGLVVLDSKVIGKDIETVKENFTSKGLVKWTKESFDTFENFFNDDNWLILQTEFGEVVKVEVGAIINSKDEFDWKFKK